MVIRNTTLERLNEALAMTNQRFEGNVRFNRLDRIGSSRLYPLESFRVTLKVASSKEPGHSLGYLRPWDNKKPRRLVAACWHVHGEFFDALLGVSPRAIIRTELMSRGKKRLPIYLLGGKVQNNWVDADVGSIMCPQLMSQKCECSQRDRGMEVRRVQQSQMTGECWPVQFRGLEACLGCEYRNTELCGGPEIRKTGKNSLGFKVPLGEEMKR